MSAASKRSTAGCVRKKDTSPRHADLNKRNEKTSQPSGLNTWMPQPKLMTAIGIKSTSRQPGGPAFPTRCRWPPLHKRGRRRHRRLPRNNGKPGQQRLRQGVALLLITRPVSQVELFAVETVHKDIASEAGTEIVNESSRSSRS